MEKDKLKIISLLLVVVILSTIMGLLIRMSTEQTDISDDYRTIKFHKDYKILQVDQYLKEGEQYDYICIDWFQPWNTSNSFIIDESYGFLTVNKTTNKIEFIQWQMSNNSWVDIDSGFVNLTDFDYILYARWNKKMI